MKNKIIFLLIVAFTVFVSCSSPNEPSGNDISVIAGNNMLKVTNNTGQTIHLFVTEQKSAALINWAVHFDEPKIVAHSSKEINYADIYYYSEVATAPKSGDKVVVYYWYSSDKDNTVIFSKVATLE